MRSPMSKSTQSKEDVVSSVLSHCPSSSERPAYGNVSAVLAVRGELTDENQCVPIFRPSYSI